MGGWHSSPPFGCGNREVHIIGVAEANLADLFLGRGIEQRRSVVAVRRDESAVDVDRVDGAHGITPFHHFGERYAPSGSPRLIALTRANRLQRASPGADLIEH